MENKILAIENYENICFCCLKEKPIKKHTIYGRGYGSSFDYENTYLQLCEECTPEGIVDWFNETPEMKGHCEEYKYEDKIIEYVNTLPLQGQELFRNRLSSDGWGMGSQDWIDMKLGILPDEVYEEDYGMYSPRQIKAYNERFPTCEHPVNAVFNDHSKGCYCPFGSSGNYNQETDGNISVECFNCNKYKVREKPIKEMDYNTYKKYEVYIKGKEFNYLFE